MSSPCQSKHWALPRCQAGLGVYRAWRTGWMTTTKNQARSGSGNDALGGSGVMGARHAGAWSSQPETVVPARPPEALWPRWNLSFGRERPSHLGGEGSRRAGVSQKQPGSGGGLFPLRRRRSSCIVCLLGRLTCFHGGQNATLWAHSEKIGATEGSDTKGDLRSLQIRAHLEIAKCFILNQQKTKLIKNKSKISGPSSVIFSHNFLLRVKLGWRCSRIR